MWGGKAGRLSGKHVKSMNRKWHALRPENPHGVPKAVMRALAWQQLPFDKEAYQRELSELLTAYKSNSKG
jgi:hypothetical protein